jgi:hypothetical protein
VILIEVEFIGVGRDVQPLVGRDSHGAIVVTVSFAGA